MLDCWLRRAGARAEFFLVSNNMMDEINQEAIRLGGRPRCFIATKEAVDDLGEDVIFALGNDGARLLKNHFGADPECPCWIADDFDFDQATKTGKTGQTYRLIAYLNDDCLLICVAKQGQIGVPDNEGEQSTPRPPLPEWANQWGKHWAGRRSCGGGPATTEKRTYNGRFLPALSSGLSPQALAGPLRPIGGILLTPPSPLPSEAFGACGLTSSTP